MTREEREAAIDKLKADIKYWENTSVSTDHLHVAIKAIEQEPILDKVRAEINGMHRVILKGTPKDDWAVRWNDCLDEVLQIIDKYKAESEGGK